MRPDQRDIPEWLQTPQRYQPVADRDSFVSRNLLAVTSVLARFRLDDGHSGRLSPTAGSKVVLGLTCILLTSLARNHLFVLFVLAGVLARASLLPPRALARVAAGSGAAAGLTLLVMAPATLLGQPQSALSLATKSLVCVAITLIVSVTTAPSDLTHLLRRMGVPGIAILTVDLALRSIVCLGETAGEVLAALSLRSVGRNRRKQSSMGGVGGVVLLKAGRSAQDTHDAMRCRGFDGEYRVARHDMRPGWPDVACLVLLSLLLALFLYLQKVI